MMVRSTGVASVTLIGEGSCICCDGHRKLSYVHDCISSNRLEVEATEGTTFFAMAIRVPTTGSALSPQGRKASEISFRSAVASML